MIIVDNYAHCVNSGADLYCIVVTIRNKRLEVYHVFYSYRPSGKYINKSVFNLVLPHQCNLINVVSLSKLFRLFLYCQMVNWNDTDTYRHYQSVILGCGVQIEAMRKLS